MSRLHFSGLFLAVSLALAGCGGGGSGGNNGGPSTKTPTYTGSTAPAVATEENASDLATASIEGVKAAVRDDALELFLALQQAPQQEPAEWLASHSIDLLKNWPATSSPTLRAATELLTGTCGGNVTMEQAPRQQHQALSISGTTTTAWKAMVQTIESLSMGECG